MAGSGGMTFDIYSICMKKWYIFFGAIFYHILMVCTISMKAELYTTQSFEEIRTSSFPHFVMFYAPWCGHCKRVQSIWDKFAAENHKARRMKVAKVDCTETTPLCAAENIKAYPTFLLFNKQQKYTFRGNRDIPDFNDFVNSLVTNLKDGQVPLESATSTKTEVEKEDDTPKLPLLLTKDTFNAEIEQDYTFVDFYAPWCSHCNKLEPTWNKLADTLKYNKKVTIAKVDCTADPELCQSHNINGYPTLNLYKDGYLFTQYNQGRSLANLVGFVQSQLSSGVLQEDHADEGSKEQPPSEESDPLSLTVKLKDETYKEMMKKSPHLIYFHDAGPQFSNLDLLIFEQVQHRLRFLNYDVTVAVIDCSETNLVCTELGISHFPSIIYFKSLSDYTQYYGMIDVEKLVEWVLKQTGGNKVDDNKEEL